MHQVIQRDKKPAARQTTTFIGHHLATVLSEAALPCSNLPNARSACLTGVADEEAP